MDTNSIFRLIDAGFTAAEIRTFMGESKPAEQTEKPAEVEEKPVEQEKPVEAKPAEKPDRTDEILGAISKLTKAIQFSNLKNTDGIKNDPESAEEIIQKALGGNIIK